MHTLRFYVRSLSMTFGICSNRENVQVKPLFSTYGTLDGRISYEHCCWTWALDCNLDALTWKKGKRIQASWNTIMLYVRKAWASRRICKEMSETTPGDQCGGYGACGA
mmetsp:Transcript_12209/g.29122  ORF Transcript_12209/g.29122 Transcript_12209/m.29122 type:complete len:108 (-) Transcript_12209:1753-2076(-)